MRKSLRFIVLCGVLWAGGCAAGRSAKPAAAPATAPAPEAEAEVGPVVVAMKGDAYLALDEVPGRPELASVGPTSQPTGRPPVESINLYARAMHALHGGRRFTAINQLERALELDPNSFELNYALGRAHEAGRSHDEQSILALTRAAAMDPDHLELQTNLGRQHLARGDQATALKHLRLAVQTTAYKAGGPGAAVADLFLGRALQQTGYDRAALEQYASLLRRVQGRAPSVRDDPHLAFLVTDQLYIDIGDLYARNGMFADALAAYEPVASRQPEDFDIQARLVRALIGLRRYDEAADRATEAVMRSRASKQSVELLREVHRAGGSERRAADELAAAHAERPGDAAVLFALLELLKEDGRWSDAEGYLAARAENAPGDSEVVRRWVHLRLERDDPEGAARLLVQMLAERPDLAGEIDNLWADVISPARPAHFRLAQLQALDASPSQAAARELSVAAVAGHLRREGLVDQALARATAARPPFAPAFRQRLSRVWHRRGADDAERMRLTDELIAAAASDPALVRELTGLSLLYREQDQAAVEALGELVQAAGESAAPALRHEYASALRAAGDTRKFEQVMSKLLSDRPSYEDGYSTLYSYYSEAGSEAQTDRVLTTWLGAVPHSTSARLLQAAGHFRAGRAQAAEQVMSLLLQERGDDPAVLSTAYAFHTRTGRTDALVTALETRVREQPGNVAAASVLVQLYDDKGRGPDAARLIDAARAAVGDDPDQLYHLAHLYTRIGHRPATEATLRQALEVDPSHPPAGNDLGYGWAERGENLAAAEELIRRAVAAEPENASFLDSLGWVLYKRGRFGEARPHLEQAAADGASADPVALDHLGDLLYRLGDRDAAGASWTRAAAKLADDASARDDLKQLKLQLERKAAQLKAGGPVTVSPVAEKPAQAKRD